jgi:hypothetical protein
MPQQPTRHGAGISVWKMPNCTSAHLRASGENLIFDDLTLQKTLLGEIAPFRAGSPGASNRKQLNPNLNPSGFPAANCHFGKKLQ